MATTETRRVAAEAPAALSTADPAPLGLAGFAATTFVLSFVNAGLVDAGVAAAVLPLALFYGGLAQLLAGLLEYRRGNTFGTTAFTTYGAFWLAFAFYEWFFKSLAGTHGGTAAGMFLLMFGIVTAYLTIAALRVSGAVLTVFVLLTLTFVLLAIGALAGASGITKVGGFVGILTALAAFYASAAIVINATWKRVVLPVFPF
ncbi:MAG TPA: acetate uptake transporter [Pseudonocardiaceae bacterium]|nr:acetate uptake transporter [Pseudonocardiaceae bacterium]